ncbi:MAG TPA: hypothetical protein VKX40_00420 [Aequorivita sp.]|nr:hypothetical protein [Aequorivita sp.]
MNAKKILLVCLLTTTISTFSFSQSKQRKTDVNKDIDLVRVYEQVVREGYGTPFIYKELASAYYFQSKYDKSVSWFQKLFETEKNTDPELAHRYNQALKAVAAQHAKYSKNAILFK